MNVLVENRTKNGSLLFCDRCGKYEIVYKNIYLKFDECEFRKYKNHMSKIHLCISKTNRKLPQKIRIATLNSSHSVLVSKEELSEFYQLLHLCPKFVFFRTSHLFSLN